MVSSILSSVLVNVPSLRLRKDIWTHFPVCLIRLPHSSDGHDRYAIQWHHKNLDAWCQKIPHYQHITRLRLIAALSAAKDRWDVEAPKAPGDLCVISMQFSEEPREVGSLPNIYSTVNRIDSVEEIRKYFPVCWKSRQNQHTLEFHNTYVKALAEKMGMDVAEIRRITIERLLPAMRAGEWAIALPNKLVTSEICTIHK